MSLMKLLLHSKAKPEYESIEHKLCFSGYSEEMITEACGHSGHEHQGISAMIRCLHPLVGRQPQKIQDVP